MDDVGLFEQRERCAQLVFVNSRYSRQKIVGELPPNHRGYLREPAPLRDTVEPLHQGVMQRLRYCERGRVRSWLEIVLARSRGYRSLYDAVRQFFYEQRHAIWFLDNLVENRFRYALAAHKTPNHQSPDHPPAFAA